MLAGRCRNWWQVSRKQRGPEWGARWRLWITRLEAGASARVDLVFFFQAEDGIRDYKVTGVQTCALPICCPEGVSARRHLAASARGALPGRINRQNLGGDTEMKGNVIGFDPDTNTGAISGHDGRRYDFVMADWHDRRHPTHGDVVDFDQIGRAHV